MSATHNKRKLASANDRAAILQAVQAKPGLVVSELARIVGVTYFRARALLSLLMVGNLIYSIRKAVVENVSPPTFAAHIYPGMSPERLQDIEYRKARRDPLVAALFGPGPAARS